MRRWGTNCLLLLLLAGWVGKVDGGRISSSFLFLLLSSFMLKSILKSCYLINTYLTSDEAKLTLEAMFSRRSMWHAAGR
jgi:hypothetical protein